MRFNPFIILYAILLLGTELAAFVGLPVSQHTQFQRFVTISLFFVVVLLTEIADKEFRDR